MLHTALRAYLLAAKTEVDASTYLKEKENVSITNKQTSKQANKQTPDSRWCHWIFQ
jgi:hypothetical protein